MQYVVDGDKAIIRIDIGEDLFASILTVANKEHWQTAQLSGIGALQAVQLGFYNLDAKEYQKKLFPDVAELVSLTGNLSVKDGERFLHLHASLAGPDFACYGGHLFSAQVGVTCEVNVNLLAVDSQRVFVDCIGLAHLEF